MCFTHEEIVLSMQEDIEQLNILKSCRPKKAHIEPEYEDDEEFGPNPESILPLLDRWGDRQVPRMN